MYIHRVTKNTAVFSIKLITLVSPNMSTTISLVLVVWYDSSRKVEEKKKENSCFVKHTPTAVTTFSAGTSDTEWSVVFSWKEPPTVYRLCGVTISGLSVTRQSTAPCSDEPVHTSVTFQTIVDNLPLSAVCYTGHFKARVDILLKQHTANLHANNWQRKKTPLNNIGCCKFVCYLVCLRRQATHM